MINFGKYDQKVSFISYQLVSDGYGGTTPTETELLETFARVRQLGSGDRTESLDLTLSQSYQIGIQVRESFTPTVSMMVKYRDVRYKITGVVKRFERMSQEWVINIVQA